MFIRSVKKIETEKVKPRLPKVLLQHFEVNEVYL